MRILIPVTWIPYPPENGARVRTWEIARRLARHHEIVFALHVRRSEDNDSIRELRRQGFGVISGPVNRGLRNLALSMGELVRGGPPIAGLRRSHVLESRLSRELAAKPFDVIQVEHGVLARYPFLLPRHPGTVLSITLHDLLSESYARMARLETSHAWRVWRRINAAGFRRMDEALLPRYDVCICVSERDRAAISRFVPAERTLVFSNGVDLLANTLLPEPSHSAPVILFVGHMEYLPNADAARWILKEIFPLIRMAYPGARLILAGGYPPPDLMKQQTPGVEITGSVPDLGPHYRQADVVLAPLRAGGGTRLKILEAMARGRPVVSTSLGAEGLDVIHDRHLLIAETPKDFAASVAALLGNPAQRERIRRTARQLVEDRYGWDQCADQHLELYARLGEERRSAAGLPGQS